MRQSKAEDMANAENADVANVSAYEVLPNVENDQVCIHSGG